MKKDVERYKWTDGKLQDEAKLELSWKKVKDKISSVKETGNSKMKMFVLPLANRRDKTGAAVDEDSTDQLDWEDILKRAKWPLLRTYYYDLFKAHPTMGVALSLDTASSSETESGSLSSETVQPEGMAPSTTTPAAVDGSADFWSSDEDAAAAAIPDAPAVDELEDNDPDDDDEVYDDQEKERVYAAEDEDDGPVRPVVAQCSRLPPPPPRQCPAAQCRHTPIRAAALPSRVASSQQQVVSPQQQQFLSGLGEIMNTQSQNMLAIQVMYHYSLL